MEGIGKLSVIGGDYDSHAPNKLGELKKRASRGDGGIKMGRVKKVEWKVAIQL